MYFELLLEDSAKGLCYENINPSSIFPCSLLLWLFPLPLSPSCRFASRQTALRIAAGPNAWLFLGKQVLAFLGVYLTSWIERSKPNIHELACKNGGLETGLGYVDVLGP